jgi:hypothetical protein
LSCVVPGDGSLGGLEIIMKQKYLETEKTDKPADRIKTEKLKKKQKVTIRILVETKELKNKTENTWF